MLNLFYEQLNKDGKIASFERCYATQNSSESSNGKNEKALLQFLTYF